MKKILNYSMMLLAFGVLLSQYACNDEWNPLKDDDTGEDIPLFILDPDFYSTKLLFTFVDSETGELLDGEEIVFELYGEKANDVIDFLGNKYTEFTTDNGINALALDPNITLSDSNPLELNLQAYTMSGLISMGGEIYFNQDGDYSIQVEMYDPFGGFKSSSAIEGYAFENLFNNQSVQGNGNWYYSESIVQEGNKIYYNSYAPKTNVSGEVIANLITGDESLLSSYGIEGKCGGSYISGSNKVNITNERFPSCILKSYVELDGYSFCPNGVDITIENNDSDEGSSTIKYLIESYLPSTDTWVICKEGAITHHKFPYTINSGGIYCPDDATKFRFSALSNSQFQVISSAQEVTELCESSFTVQVKTNEELHPYGINLVVGCVDNNSTLISPTTNITMRDVDGGSPFIIEISGGSAVLYLKPLATYQLKTTYGGEDINFEFAFDESLVDEKIEESMDENSDFDHITCDVEMINGIKYFNVHIYFKPSACPY